MVGVGAGALATQAVSRQPHPHSLTGGAPAPPPNSLADNEANDDDLVNRGCFIAFPGGQAARNDDPTPNRSERLARADKLRGCTALTFGFAFSRVSRNHLYNIRGLTTEGHRIRQSRDDDINRQFGALWPMLAPNRHCVGKADFFSADAEGRSTLLLGSVLEPDHLAPFASRWFMAANFRQSLMYRLWQQHGAVFHELVRRQCRAVKQEGGQS